MFAASLDAVADWEKAEALGRGKSLRAFSSRPSQSHPLNALVALAELLSRRALELQNQRCSSSVPVVVRSV
jgi:hypothetical protein